MKILLVMFVYAFLFVLISGIYCHLRGLFPTIYPTHEYVVKCICGHVDQKERSENAGRLISDWKLGFSWFVTLFVHWIPSNAHTTSLSNSGYTHTHLQGFNCEKCLWLSPGALYYGYTETMERRYVSSGDTVLKWQLHKSWCMICLLQN